MIMNMMKIFMDRNELSPPSLQKPKQQQQQHQKQKKTIVLKNDQPFVKLIEDSSTFATQSAELFPTLSLSSSSRFTIKQEEASKQIMLKNNQNGKVRTIDIVSLPSSSSQSSSADRLVNYYKPIKRQRIEKPLPYINELHMLQSLFMKQIVSSDYTKPYLCDYPKCGFNFKQSESLLEHMKMAHTKQYKCSSTTESCGMRFSCRALAREHTRSHSIPKNYQCSVEGCLKRFSSSALLDGHVHKHDEPNSLICPMEYCDKVYSSLYNFGVHVDSHSDDGVTDGELKCTDCGQQLTTLRNLAIHRRLHANECSFESCAQVKLDNHKNCSSHRLAKKGNVRLKLIKPVPSSYLTTTTTTQTIRVRRRPPPPPVDPAIVAQLLEKHNIQIPRKESTED